LEFFGVSKIGIAKIQGRESVLLMSPTITKFEGSRGWFDVVVCARVCR